MLRGSQCEACGVLVFLLGENREPKVLGSHAQGGADGGGSGKDVFPNLAADFGGQDG